ncbi:DUF1604-domain-containing protein [Pholiota conissans]|uniref:DUF1604-domain-containing protein n=1 Tax=Pholiota conissans TaxID=109636 RepID=A0A9P5YT13_9AGAR|nr:DUF1604-domain-containing protein [Pholiota conissans]
MTTRLKRKLGELGVDTSSRKANENFCLIGTPLPPLEKSKDTGEFVPLWKQEVRDEKGRRRLHGAFTGGFSAGYFNTVGSKEGWTPATFTSSRNDRAKKAAMRPEDFMDEEDIQDLKDNRTIVDTTEEMDFMGGTQAELQGKSVDDSEKDPITRALETSLLPAPKDSVGAKMLKKMGWRLGQGIGPRISLKQRKLQDTQAYDALTGTRYSGTTLDLPEDDEEANKHTYAPRDTPILVVKRKDNFHGLGYVPGRSLQDSLGNTAAGVSKGPKLAGGFGLGALNDADEDDLDVYDHDHRSSRERVAYDHINGDDDDTVVIGGRSSKRNVPAPRSSSSVQHFRDGHPVLTGFILSDHPVAEDKWFPLPDVPAGWKPDPKRVWSKNKENIQTPAPVPHAQPHAQWKKSQISADQRGSILGEAPLQAAQRSVFDYMSEKDKERIKRITSGLKGASETGSSIPGPPPPPVSLAKLEPHIAQAALRGFQPFKSDPVKQARYNAYLLSQANTDGSSPPLKRLPTQAADEFQKELEDYAKAASLFKPMSGAMAGRFTSAAVIEAGPKIIEGLHTPSEEEIAEKEAQKKKEEEDRISPKAHAAKMGMYGPLTRETKPWQPAKLLCKRFGVKEPNPEPEVSTEPMAGPSSSAASASFTHPEFDQPVATAAGKDDTAPSQQIDKPRDLANIGLGEDETQGQDTLTYERPSMDIFKAIFASDSEDSDDETPDNDDEEDVAAPAKPKETGFISATTILDDTPIDMSTFKPTFIPREGKNKKSKDDDKAKEKKEKKDKKKKEKKAVLVSFEVDEDGADTLEVKQPKDRPKKKRKEKIAQDGQDHGMWATKPPDEFANTTPEILAPAVPPDQDLASSQATGPKGRKRAIDFM